jgi:hypothetical protein
MYMTFFWKNFSGCKVWAILGRSKSLGVLYCCWVIYLQLPPPSCGTCATLSSTQHTHNANGHTVVSTQLGDREAERQADRRTPKNSRLEDRVIHQTSTLPCMAKFVYSDNEILDISSKIHSHWPGGKINSNIGLSYARLHRLGPGRR